MPTYVDVEPLIKWCTYCADDDIVRVDRIVMANMLRNAPTVDAEPVVRCKDCRHSFMGNYFKGYACKRLSGEHTFTVSPDDFCSKGERRE